MTSRKVKDYLQDILTTIKLTERFLAEVTFTDFQNDFKTNFAVIRALEIIGEAVKYIPQELRDRYPQTPWKGFTGIRDKLIHGYFRVDLEIVWDTVQQDLPILHPVIVQMLRDLTEEENKET
jgi:uncharacterized protein with HEPN domain